MGKGTVKPKADNELADTKFKSVVEYDSVDRSLGSIVLFYKGTRHVATVNHVDKKIYISK